MRPIATSLVVAISVVPFFTAPTHASKREFIRKLNRCAAALDDADLQTAYTFMVFAHRTKPKPGEDSWAYITVLIEAVRGYYSELDRVAGDFRTQVRDLAKDYPEYKPELELFADLAGSVESLSKTQVAAAKEAIEVLKELKEAQDKGDAATERRARLRVGRPVRRAFAAFAVFEEASQNYGVQIEALLEKRRSDSQLWKSLLKALSEVFAVEIRVEHKRIPVAVTLNTGSGVSVSMDGVVTEHLGTVKAGSEITLGKDPDSRRLYVESEGGTRLSYKLADKKVALSFPVLQYRMEYRGFHIVLSLRTRD